MAFEHLLSPLQVGPITRRNRVVSTAHGALLGCYPDNDDGKRYIAYQEARAKGGCGLIILLPIQVHRTSQVNSKRETRIAAVDAIMIAAGNKARPELFRALKDRVAQVLIAGDAVAPRNALTVIHEGDRAGRAI